MYSYGKQPNVHLDAEYCQRLHSYSLSQDRMIIIVYLKVDAYVDEEGQKKYKVGSYGNTDNSPEMWILHTVEGRNILLFYPRPEIFEMIPRLMAAYNTQNLDVLKAICTEDVGLEHFEGGRTLNDGFYSNLSYNYEKYGKMKMAYVRYNDVLFSAVPYLEDFCYISFSVTNDTDRICNIVEKPLDDNFRELLVTDIVPEADMGNEYPLISNVVKACLSSMGIRFLQLSCILTAIPSKSSVTPEWMMFMYPSLIMPTMGSVWVILEIWIRRIPYTF